MFTLLVCLESVGVAVAATTMVFEDKCILGCLKTKMSLNFGVLRVKKQMIG
jgi:hypothetical protein